MLKSIFPFSFKADTVGGLVVAIVGYILCGAVFGLVLSLIAAIPFIGWAFKIISSVVGLYLLIGLIVAVLVYLKIVK